MREKEDGVHSVFGIAQIGVWDFDPATGQVHLDERAGAFLACPTDRPVSCEEVLSRIHPESRKTIERWVQAGIDPRSDGNFQIKFRVIWPDGLIRNLLGRGKTFISSDGERQLSHVMGTIRDLTMSQTVETALDKSRERFQNLVETINDWVWEVNQNGVYTYASPRVKDLLGYEPDEVIGKTPFDFMPDREKNRVINEFNKFVSIQKPFWSLENTNSHKDGHLVVLETSGVPFFDEKGALLGYRGVDRDISERKRAEEELVESNRELDAFVYTVSHDLRTPLTPIIGYAEALQETCRDRLDKQSLDCLAEIERQGHEMLSLMEDLLALAKVGHVQRPVEAVDLNSVVEEVLVGMGSLVAEAGVIAEKNPLPKLRIPKTLLTQIFNNLIGNSIRYAGSEGSPIEIGGERRGDLVRLYVRDHGPGIPKEEGSQIFEVFYRGAIGKKTPGTGVGLTTVLKISRLYGGRAWVEETPGGGSTFWVELMDIQNPCD